MKSKNINQKSNFKKNIFIIVVAIFISCVKKIKIEEIFKSAYYSDFNKCQMDVLFKSKKDTIFFSYKYAMDNGNYLNTADDVKNDFAGYFLRSDIIENQVSFKIKNFRYSSDAGREIYNKIKLTFVSNDEIVWDTDLTNEKNKFVPYLPNTVTLKMVKTR